MNKIEEGLWFEFSEWVYGVKVPEYIRQRLVDEMEINPDENYHEGQGPSLFRLHHDWDSLDGYFAGDQTEPREIIIGTDLHYYMENNKNDDFSPSMLLDALEEIKDFWNDFNQIEEIKCFLEDEDVTPTLHLVTCRYFLSKREIEKRYVEFPKLYPNYRDYLEADCWNLREIR